MKLLGTPRPSMPRRACAAILLTWTFAAPAMAQEAETTLPDSIQNGSFENGEVGAPPVGWRLPPGNERFGYRITVVDGDDCQRCVEVSRPAGPRQMNAAGSLNQTLDARGLQGKRIRLSAAVRTALAPGGRGAQLWLRVNRADGRTGFLANMADRPIRDGSWQRYEILAEVADDAAFLHFGLMLLGDGKAWLDDARLEVLGDAAEGREAPRALSERGLANLVAFSRLFGYLRYFHPSDEGAEADWNRLALAGVGDAEAAGDDDALARVLGHFFRPVAPTLAVWTTGAPPPLPSALAQPAPAGAEVVGWRHVGHGNPEQQRYRSERIDDAPQGPQDSGQLVQTLDARPYRGQRLRFAAAVRDETLEPGGAHLRLEIRREKHAPEIFEPSSHSQPSEPSWQRQVLEAEVPADALEITVGLRLEGGRARLDEATLSVVGDGEDTPIPLTNGGLETAAANRLPQGWALSAEAVNAGYRAEVDGAQAAGGEASALLHWPQPPGRAVASPSEPLTVELIPGVRARFAMGLYRTAEGTQPKSGLPLPQPDKPAGFLPSGKDRSTRLANVVLAWNIFQHFYPYFDVIDADWPAVLEEALGRAATDPDDEAFARTLGWLVQELDDGHGNVVHASQGFSHRIPALWREIDGELMITRVSTGVEALQPGDVVRAIDGVPYAEARAQAVETISAATPQFQSYLLTEALGTGVYQQEVELTVEDAGGETRTVQLACTSPLWGDQALAEDRPEKIAEIEEGIHYADLSRIDDADFAAAVPRLARAEGVILDLRGYPRRLSTIVLSHLIDEPVTSAQWHVPVIIRPDRKGLEFEVSDWQVEPRKPRLSGKVAFLIDGRAISYAETYMGIVEHYRLAEIFGEATAGTNGNINPMSLPGGYRIVWTGMKVLKHDGSRHHGIGILPTQPIERTREGVAAGRDEILEAAVEWIRRSR